MSVSSDLKRERDNYERALKYAVNTANELKNSISSLSTALQAQNTSYIVNDVGGGGSYLSDLLETERQVYSNITGNVIPGARSKISSLNYRISAALKKEAAEKQANS